MQPSQGNTRWALYLEKFGEYMNLEQIAWALGYSGSDAVKKAYQRNKLPVSLVKLPGRTKLFASSREVARLVDEVSGPLSEDKSGQIKTSGDKHDQ